MLRDDTVAGAASSTAVAREPARRWKFTDLLAEEGVRARWEKVRQYFFLRESTYDMTNICNLVCDGCYYFEGEKQHAKHQTDPVAWRTLMRSERERGITFVVLAGAEPALVPHLCKICFDEIPTGAIATNGIKRIPRDIGYKIHVSVWGSDATSRAVRGAKTLLGKQITNYADDPRAVFVYTFTRSNIDESYGVVAQLSEANCRVTFNMFSSPLGYRGVLRHDSASLAQTRTAMLELAKRYPKHVVFSPYNAVAHTEPRGLHDLYSCLYPRRNPSPALGLGRSFRQYRVDLTWDRDAACCVPDTDCADCRHYAAGSAIVTGRLQRHAVAPDTFKAWLDYVDTYLAVWVMGYDKGENLCPRPVEPPRSDR